MKRLTAIALMALLYSVPAMGQAIPDLDNQPDLDPNDVMYVVDDPNGTPADRKLTITTLTTYLQSLFQGLDSDLTTWSGISPHASWQDILDGDTTTDSNNAAARVQMEVQKQYAIDVTEGPYNASTGSADNQAALQAALDALAAAGGGILILPAGTYQYQGEIKYTPSASSDKVTVSGIGGEAFFDQVTPDANGLTINPNATFTMDDFVLENVSIRTAAGTGDALVIKRCARFVVNNVRIDGAGRYGLRLYGSLIGSIRDLKCTTNNGFSGAHAPTDAWVSMEAQAGANAPNAIVFIDPIIETGTCKGINNVGGLSPTFVNGAIESFTGDYAMSFDSSFGIKIIGTQFEGNTGGGLYFTTSKNIYINPGYTTSTDLYFTACDNVVVEGAQAMSVNSLFVDTSCNQVEVRNCSMVGTVDMDIRAERFDMVDCYSSNSDNADHNPGRTSRCTYPTYTRGVQDWDSTSALTYLTTRGTATVTRCGTGEADTTKQVGTYSAKVVGAAQYDGLGYQLSADTYGQWFSVDTYVKVVSGKVGLRFYTDVGTTVYTLCQGSTGTQWAHLQASFRDWFGNPIGYIEIVDASSGGGSEFYVGQFSLFTASDAGLGQVTGPLVSAKGGIATKNGTTSAGYVDFYEDLDNGTNRIRVIGPASTGDATLTLPNDTEVAETGLLANTAGTLSTTVPNAGTDITADLEEETHASEHAVGGGDTVFPADPDADRVLGWNDGSSQIVWTPAGAGDFLADGSVPMTGSLYITEAAAASGDTAGLGQIWVKNTTPNELWFTNDAGTDIQLGVAGIADMLKSVYDVSDDGFVDGNDVPYNVTTWNGDVNAVSMNSIRDYLVNLDADGDGLLTDETWLINLMTLYADLATYDNNSDGTVDAADTATTVTNGVYTTDAGTVFLAPNGDGSALTNVDAATGDSATAFFDAGTIEHERGGLQADISLYTGLIAVTGADTTAEIDSKTELEGQLADVSDLAMADGDIYSGTHDFGAADDLEVPNGANPTTDTAGQIAVDTDDDFIEFYGSAERAVPTLLMCSKTIYDPDGLQGAADFIPMLPVEVEAFPHGITIKDCGIKTWDSSSYSVNFEEWTSPSDGAPSTIETVATSTSYEAADDGTLTDSAIAAGSIVGVDLPATDTTVLMVWFTYYVNPGD